MSEKHKHRLEPERVRSTIETLCSELFSLTGKVAAVYVEAIDDPPVLAAAGEIETLCTGLSRKVWQKINVLQTLRWQLSEPSTIAEAN